jgi:hypothetical protein
MVNFFRFCMLLICNGLLLILSGCEKEELPVPPHQSGNVTSNQLVLGNDYRNQLFYHLSSNKEVSRHLKTDWDLGFEASEAGWHIVLNSARGGAATSAKGRAFANIINTSGLNWKWDVHSGNLDSTAIGDYREQKMVVVIDRGYDHLGNHTGYRKLQIEDVNDNSYRIRYALLDNSKDTTIVLHKDSSLNMLSFSFDHHAAVPIEPTKSEWDLLFTQYIHLFEDPPTPYLVMGVLINRYRTAVAVETIKPFEEISRHDLSEYHFNDAVNAIGYDWKEYDLGASLYTVFPQYNYIIKTQENRYFKLHFVNFYSTSGEKGAPKFDLQEL